MGEHILCPPIQPQNVENSPDIYLWSKLDRHHQQSSHSFALPSVLLHWIPYFYHVLSFWGARYFWRIRKKNNNEWSMRLIENGRSKGPPPCHVFNLSRNWKNDQWAWDWLKRGFVSRIVSILEMEKTKRKIHLLFSHTLILRGKPTQSIGISFTGTPDCASEFNKLKEVPSSPKGKKLIYQQSNLLTQYYFSPTNANTMRPWNWSLPSRHNADKVQAALSLTSNHTALVPSPIPNTNLQDDGFIYGLTWAIHSLILIFHVQHEYEKLQPSQ